MRIIVLFIMIFVSVMILVFVMMMENFCFVSIMFRRIFMIDMIIVERVRKVW